jgi:ATP synthase F1 gamma subunit
MKQLNEIAQQQSDMAVIVQLTSAFESLASMHISRLKSQVLQAEAFFHELWQIYQQLRVDNLFHFGREQREIAINKQLFIMITAEGGFSGDIDQRLIDMVLKEYDPVKHDLIVVGHHGAVLLQQVGITFKKYFKLPEKNQNINVEPLIREMRQYQNTAAFYQSYVSLTVQDVKRIELGAAVQAEGRNAKASKDIISEATYIFEPSAYDVIAHLERSMLQIALAQLIFDSKLAQYASRFRAMSAAHDRADTSLLDFHTLYNHTRREIRDQRLKETINGMKKVGAQ